MKKVYVPSGETVTHSFLHTDRIVVNGVLQVSGKLIAKEIVGRGSVEACEIVCDEIRTDSVTADNITARRIISNKLFTNFECRASESIAVKDYISADYVCTGRLSMSLSNIHTCDADEIITLRQQHSMLGLLWRSWWRGLFLDLFHHEKKDTPSKEDSDKGEKNDETPEPVHEQEKDSPPISDDASLELMITVLSNLREQGYRVTRNEDAA